MKVTKQSLIDWEVTKDGKHVAWITKEKTGLYTVTIKGIGEYKGYRKFKDAKEFATT